MARQKRIWRESQHPRDGRGRFAKRGGAAWIKRAAGELMTSDATSAGGRPRISRNAKAGVVLQAHTDGGRPSAVRVPQAVKTAAPPVKNLDAFNAPDSPKPVKRTARPASGAAALIAARAAEQAPHTPAMVAARTEPVAAPSAGAAGYAAMRRHTLVSLARNAGVRHQGRSNGEIGADLAAKDAEVKAARAAKLNPSAVGVDTSRVNPETGGMTERETKLAAKRAELEAAQKRVQAEMDWRPSGGMRTKSFGVRADANIRRGAQAHRDAERLEREIAALERSEAPKKPVTNDVEGLEPGDLVKMKNGLTYKVAKVNAKSVKVVVPPGMDDLMPKSKIVQTQKAAVTAPKVEAPAAPRTPTTGRKQIPRDTKIRAMENQRDGGRGVVNRHRAVTRAEFDAMPENERERVLQDLRQVARSKEEESYTIPSNRSSMGMTVRGVREAAHVKAAKEKLRELTYTAPPPVDNSIEGRAARLKAGDVRAIDNATIADLNEIARGAGLSGGSTGWPRQKLVDYIRNQVEAGDRLKTAREGNLADALRGATPSQVLAVLDALESDGMGETTVAKLKAAGKALGIKTGSDKRLIRRALADGAGGAAPKADAAPVAVPAASNTGPAKLLGGWRRNPNAYDPQAQTRDVEVDGKRYQINNLGAGRMMNVRDREGHINTVGWENWQEVADAIRKAEAKRATPAAPARARITPDAKRGALARTNSPVDTPRVKSQNGGMTNDSAAEARRNAVIEHGTRFTGNPYSYLPKFEALTDEDFAALTPDQQDNVRFVVSKLAKGAQGGEVGRSAQAMEKRFGKWGASAPKAPKVAAKPGETTLGVTTSSRGRTTTVTLPDGSTAQRTSKTMEYSHAVVATTDNHAEANSMRETADRHDAFADALEAWIANGSDMSQLRRVRTGTGSMAMSEQGIVNYGYYLPGFEPTIRTGKSGAKWAESQQGSTAVETRDLHRDGTPVPLKDWQEEYHGPAAHQEILSNSRGSATSLRERAAGLDAGPQYSYSVDRWSQRPDSAHAAIGSPELSRRNTRYDVIGVGGVAEAPTKPVKALPTAAEKAAAKEAAKVAEKAAAAKRMQDFFDSKIEGVTNALNSSETGGSSDPEWHLQSVTEAGLVALAKHLGAKVPRREKDGSGHPRPHDRDMLRKLIIDAVRARSAEGKA